MDLTAKTCRTSFFANDENIIAHITPSQWQRKREKTTQIQ